VENGLADGVIVPDGEASPTLTSEPTVARGESSIALLPPKESKSKKDSPSKLRCGRPVTQAQWRLVYVLIAVLVVVVVVVAVLVSL
jgi:hypothetical protein